MPRKPTLEDAFLLALLEAGDEGLNNTKWYMIKPSEYQESYIEFIKMEDNLVKEKLIDYIDSLDQYKLTEAGKESARSIEDEISRNEYISLMVRFSPTEELRKRTQNIETFIISSSLALMSLFGLLSLKNVTILPSYIILALFIIFLFVFAIGLTYSFSNLFRIVEFWSYYTAKHGKTRKWIFTFYKKHEKGLKNISSYVLIPLIYLLIIYGLGIDLKYAAVPILFQFFKPYIFRY